MRDNEKMGLIISRIIIFTLLLMSINAFFTQDLMIAKILSAFGFTGLLFLLLISFMAKTSAWPTSYGPVFKMVTYETLNMLFQAFTAFATMATAVIALIVLYTNTKK